MLYKNRKAENPFAVHSVNKYENPFAYSHGSNEFHYTKPRMTEKKIIEISKPKVYKTEISSDAIENPFVNRKIIHGIPALPPWKQKEPKSIFPIEHFPIERAPFPYPKDIGDPYLLKNRLPGGKLPINRSPYPIIHPIHGIPVLPPWKEPKLTFPIEKHPFIPPIGVYHPPIERTFPTYPMPSQIQPKQTQPTQIKPQPEDTGTPKGALLGVLALLLPFIF